MPREIDRCDVCAGAGRISFDAVGTHAQPAPLVICERCRSTGYLDPIASLMRAIELGQTLAWCMAHAGDGDDPLPALWARSTATREKLRLLEFVRPGRVSMIVRAGRRGRLHAAAGSAPPTLDEVLAAVKERRA